MVNGHFYEGAANLAVYKLKHSIHSKTCAFTIKGFSKNELLMIFTEIHQYDSKNNKDNHCNRSVHARGLFTFFK